MTGYKEQIFIQLSGNNINNIIGGVKMDINQMKVFENNKKMITEQVTVHPDDIVIIDNTVTKLIDTGVGNIRAVKIEDSGTWGWALLLTNDEEKVFFLQLSEYGTIELLRKDGPQGEVVSYVMYDDPEGFDIPED